MKRSAILCASCLAVIVFVGAPRTAAGSNPLARAREALAKRAVMSALTAYTRTWNNARMKVEAHKITNMSFLEPWNAFRGGATITVAVDPEHPDTSVAYSRKTLPVMFFGPKMTARNAVRMLLTPDRVPVKISPDEPIGRWDVGL